MLLKWTVVQHSAAGYRYDPQFEQGLESRQLQNKNEMNQVEKAGGLIFDNYNDAEDFAEKACYPEGYMGLIPQARGTFSLTMIDGLRVYIPVREVVG